ncbi:membrane protein [Rhodopirellula sallentina SM41]|uniref:Membrane protein n=2 Tax=Rhodopirellula TaxID=265488 RepID=M5TSF5_9BACT|nr:membrane protein [Rhodopirellula sallentina SM41]
MTTFVDYICFAGTLSAVLGVICAIVTRTTTHRVFAIASFLVSLLTIGYHVVLID